MSDSSVCLVVGVGGKLSRPVYIDPNPPEYQRGQDKPAWTACPPGVKITRVGGQDIPGQLAPRGQAVQGGGQDKLLHGTKPLFKLEREVDGSNQYMKFGRNPIKND